MFTNTTVTDGYSLETFLSGMETARSPKPPAARADLETFLSGMETRL